MGKVKKALAFAGKLLLYYAAIPFIACLVGVVFYFGLLDFVVVPAAILLIYIFIRWKKLLDMREAAVMNIWMFAAVAIVFAFTAVISKGDFTGASRTIISVVCFPFIIVPYSDFTLIIVALVTYFIAALTCAICAGFRVKAARSVIGVIVAAAALFVGFRAYGNRSEVRYAGHGFKYMHGYSSTDFTDYTVYASKSKLVTPDTDPGYMIENEEEMPVMDGAEACYPLYAAFAKAVYKNIDVIEREYIQSGQDSGANGKIVTFTNTVVGFERLVNCDADLFFGARPSKSQQEYAKNAGVELVITPIGKEAFVFFVEDDNPVDSLTSEQLRAIYHGDVTNWKDIGGKDEEIVAFQRPENSGSQTMMQYFMGETSLMDPKKYYVADMAGVLDVVAQYANEAGALGYSFRYFVEELQQEKGVKLISVDGVAPTLENIENGTYPLTVDLVLITRKNNKNARVEQMIEFILSESGQEIIRKTGYAALGN